MQNEREIHGLFIITLIGKGFFALAEFLGGIALFFVSQQYISDLIASITQNELVEDPNDFLSNLMVHGLQYLSGDVHHFAGFYLVGHGLVKGFLIIGLLKEKLWMYPIAITVFAFFIIFQTLQWARTHSLLLLAITVLDLFVIALAWHEYRYMKAHPKPAR